MNRPFSSFSIDQLEGAFEDAYSDRDRRQLKLLAQELTHRKTPRARALAVKIAAAITSLSKTAQHKKTEQTKSKTKDSSRRKPTRKPTDEQTEAIQLFARGDSLKINAFAGAGKTSTLEMLAHSSKSKGQYLAFNRDIVKDAKSRFPASVNCSTTHGLAFKSLAGSYRSDLKKLTDRINANQLSEMLGLKQWQIDREHTLRPQSFGFLVLDTVRRFAMSADKEPLVKHVPRHGSLRAASEGTLNEVNDAVISAARHTWTRMIDNGDPMPMGHDGYLKLWALGEPVIAADFILMDEAQDTNPVVLDVLRKQRAQMVYVGDKHQQIYDWRGAVNAMGAVETRHSAYLTTSFRFGAEIADAASRILRRLDESKPVRGNPALTSRIGPVERPEAILARTNSSTMKALIEALDAGKRPHLGGGPSELKRLLMGVIDLKAGKPSDVPDFFGFKNWREVVEFARGGEGEHLQTFVNLVESQGEKKLLWALGHTVDEEKSDLIISTAHKAKGREWKTVRLIDDFLKTKTPASANGSPSDDHSELRLLYVAITRAKEAIELPEPVLKLLGNAAPSVKNASDHVRERASSPKRGDASWKPPRDWQPEPETSKAPDNTNSAPERPPPRKGFLKRLFG